MDKKKLGNSLLLVLASFIWGTAFVAQSVGMDYMGPFSFNAVRMLLGSFALVPVILIMERKKAKDAPPEDKRKLLIGGILCGVAVFVSSTFQQLGIDNGTDAGKAGFITALYIVFVPILGRMFFKRKTSPVIWFCVLLAMVGMYLLCIKSGFTVALGDGLVMLCAVGFSVHILVIDHFIPYVSGVKLSCIQFLVAGVLSLPLMFTLEEPTIGIMLDAWIPILYCGIMSCSIAYTLQIVGQKHLQPAVASLLLSLESVFAVLAGWLLLKESMTAKELIGCLLVFIAIVLTQLPLDELFKSKQAKIEQEKQS